MKTKNIGCLKYLVFFFNLLFFICGVVVLAVGIWSLVNEQSFRQTIVNNSIIFNGVYIIIATGAALMFIGFLGCCGAKKDSRCLLGTFFVVVLIIFLVELAGSLYIYLKRDEVMNDVLASIGQYGAGTASGMTIKQGWDSIQNSAQCCGLKSYTDWGNNSVWAQRFPGTLVPNSCCKRDMTDKDSPFLNVTLCQNGRVGYLNREGCLPKFGSSIHVVAIVGAAILAIELLGMTFACCLYKNLNEYRHVA